MNRRSKDKRVVFLELVPTDRFKNYRSEYFPFAAGFLKECGIPTSWLCVGVESIKLSSANNPFIYDLPSEDRERVIQELKACTPTHVLLNERLSDSLWAELRRSFRNVSFRMSDFLCGEKNSRGLVQWLDVSAPVRADTSALLEEQYSPVFTKKAVNELAAATKPLIHLLVGPECVYTRKLENNPYFSQMDLSDCCRQHGCSFCACPDPYIPRPKSAVVPLAVKQVLAAEETAPWDLHNREYLVRGVNLLFKVDTFYREIIKHGVPPSSFLFSCRVDELLRVEQRLKDVLPELERTGHKVHIWNMGLENFSEAENKRFNKGLGADTIGRCFRLMRELTEDFPNAFQAPVEDGFGFILFTPWTTLEDLRTNIHHFKKWGLSSNSFLIGTALQLLPDRPITKLARVDGLLLDQSVSYPVDSGCITSWDVEETPWRFRHPEVGMVYRVVRRLVPSDVIPGDDKAFVTISTWLDDLPAGEFSVLEIFEALVEVMERNSGEQSIDAILGLVVTELEARYGLDLSDPRPSGQDTDQIEETADQATAEQEVMATREGSLYEALRAVVCNIVEQNPKASAFIRGETGEGVRVGMLNGRCSLEIDLLVRSGPLTVAVQQPGDDERYFLADGDMVLSYLNPDMVLSPSEVDKMRRILKMVSRANEKLKKKPMK